MQLNSTAFNAFAVRKPAPQQQARTNAYFGIDDPLASDAVFGAVIPRLFKIVALLLVLAGVKQNVMAQLLLPPRGTTPVGKTFVSSFLTGSDTEGNLLLSPFALGATGLTNNSQIMGILSAQAAGVGYKKVLQITDKDSGDLKFGEC